MESIVIVIHVLIALAIIGLILLQQGKGAEAGASFGAGASQTVFGSQGGGDFFSKITAVLAFVFFVTSFSLAIIAKNKSSVSIDQSGVPALEQVAPENTDIPVINDTEAVGADVPVLNESTDTTTNDVPVIELTPETAPAEENTVESSTNN